MTPFVETVPCISDPVPESFLCDPCPHRLSSEDVGILAARIAAGDREARNVLVQANLGLVWRVARHYVGRGLMMDDLVGEGNLGLIRAAEAFDPGIGARFSTYATYWIKESILRALMDTTTMIRVPKNMFRLLIKWSRTERSLCRMHGRSPSTDEIAAEMGLSERQKAHLAKARHARGLRLGTVQFPDLGPGSAANKMDSPAAAADLLEADEERNWVLERLGRLDGRERAVLILCYGLGFEPPLKYNVIGRRLGVTRDCVRKLAKQAIEKLVEGAAVDHHPPVGARRPIAYECSPAPKPGPDASGSPAGFGQPVEPSSAHGRTAPHCPESGSHLHETHPLARCG